LQNSLSSSVIVSLALSIFMLLRLFCAENVVLEKIKCTMCDLNENRLSKLEVALTMSKLIEIFTEMEVDFNFVGHFYSSERLLPHLEDDIDASTHGSSEVPSCVMKYPGYGYDVRRNECYKTNEVNSANEPDAPSLGHGERRHSLLRTNQPKAEGLAALAPLQESSTVTVFNNGETSTSCVQLGILTTRNENFAQGHEIHRQEEQNEISGDLSSYLPGESISGQSWSSYQPYPSSFISPRFE